MMPRLGEKYKDIVIEVIPKPIAEYQNDEYFELDFRWHRPSWLEMRSWLKAPIFHRTEWKRLFAGAWECRNRKIEESSIGCSGRQPQGRR
jgi:hypothetical protein